MINILTYNVPHRKTYDVLCLLKAKGYSNINVFAKPFTYKKSFKPIIEHRPPITLNNLEYLHNLSADYFDINDYSDINVCEGSIFLVCGATLLPDEFLERYKVINSHPGYIPIVRGLDSLKWAIYNDLPVGVSTHIINKDFIDAGELIKREYVDVFKNDTFHALAYRQYELEIYMLVDAISLVNKQHDIVIPETDNIVNKRMPKEIELTLLEKFEVYREKWGK